MKELAVYVRLSQQGEDEASLVRQIEQGTAWATSHGYSPVIYKEATGHRSGRTEKSRPAWRQLKDDIRSGRLAGLWVADIARASRNVRDFLDFLDLCAKSNAALISQKESIDTNSAAGRMLVTVLSALNEWYAADLGERQKRRIAFQKNKGESVGRVPLGLKRNGSKKLELSGESYVDGSGHRRKYIDTVKEWLTVYTEQDIGAYEGARLLNSRGYRWCNQKKSDRKPIPIENWHLYDLVSAELPQYAGILDKALLTAARRRFAERQSRRSNHRKMIYAPPLLWKILRCDSCDARYTIHHRPLIRAHTHKRSSRTYSFYRHHSVGCPNYGTVRTDGIDNQVLDYISRAWNTMATEEKDRIAHAAVSPHDIADATDKEHTRRKIERLKRIFLDGLIDEAEYSAQLKESKAELESIKRQEQNAELPLSYDELRPLLDNLPELVRRADPVRSNQLMRHLLLAVYIKDRHITKVVPRPLYAPMFPVLDMVE